MSEEGDEGTTTVYHIPLARHHTQHAKGALLCAPQARLTSNTIVLTAQFKSCYLYGIRTGVLYPFKPFTRSINFPEHEEW